MPSSASARSVSLAIVGAGASVFERRPEASVFQFADTALNAALADAGLDVVAIDPTLPVWQVMPL